MAKELTITFGGDAPTASEIDQVMLNAFAEKFYQMFKEAKHNDDARD